MFSSSRPPYPNRALVDSIESTIFLNIEYTENSRHSRDMQVELVKLNGKVRVGGMKKVHNARWHLHFKVQ